MGADRPGRQRPRHRQASGRHRQVSRVFRGNLRDAKKARAELLTGVGKGRHTGTAATLDDLFADWVVELRRKGRSPNTIRSYDAPRHEPGRL